MSPALNRLMPMCRLVLVVGIAALSGGCVASYSPASTNPLANGLVRNTYVRKDVPSWDAYVAGSVDGSPTRRGGFYDKKKIFVSPGDHQIGLWLFFNRPDMAKPGPYGELRPLVGSSQIRVGTVGLKARPGAQYRVRGSTDEDVVKLWIVDETTETRVTSVVSVDLKYQEVR